MTARLCTDHRCTDGVTMCRGCNGYGVLTMGGRKYKLRGGGRTIGATAVDHVECSGTGMAVCGCRPLDVEALQVLAGPVEPLQVTVEAAA